MGKPGKAKRHLVGWPAGFAWLVAGLALAGSASAGSFRINPVQINLPADRRAASLNITNSDAAPVSIRVASLAWTQVAGVDVYTPTTNVISSPPIFTIPAGKTQLVRIGLRNRTGPGAYRVIFEEIPRDTPVKDQIQVNLRLDLPLYVLPKGRAAPDLAWRAWSDANGNMFVEGRNRGALHGQVVELAAKQKGRRTLLSKSMGVVLPGSARLWKLGKQPALSTGQPLDLTVRSSTGATNTRIVLEKL